MNTSDKEKEWLKRISGKQKQTESEKAEDKEDVKETEPPPSKKGNGFADIAGMDELKKFVTEGYINVLKNKDIAKAYGIKPPSMLFYGPAGCGKTYFAEKMAEELGINFIKVVPDDIACKWIHGTQEKISQMFNKALRKAPTLLFLDEFDAMVSKRTGDDNGRSLDAEVNEFLCILNNASDRGVYVLAATNHPENIDRAILRTGRIDEMVYIDMPDKESRKSLFAYELSKLPTESIDTDRLAALTEGYNCSDISYIVKSAARTSFNIAIKSNGKLQGITQKVIEDTISSKSPSVTPKDLREYERVRSEFSPKDKLCRHNVIGFR